MGLCSETNRKWLWLQTIWYSSYPEVQSLSPPLESGKPCNQQNAKKWHCMTSEAQLERWCSFPLCAGMQVHGTLSSHISPSPWGFSCQRSHVWAFSWQPSQVPIRQHQQASCEGAILNSQPRWTFRGPQPHPASHYTHMRDPSKNGPAKPFLISWPLKNHEYNKVAVLSHSILEPEVGEKFLWVRAIK